MLTRLRALRREALAHLDSGQIDLISCHFALYGFPIADRFRSTPAVVHFQGPWAGESDAEGMAALASRAKAAVEKVVYSRARRLIVLSRAFQGELTRRYKVSEERVRVVPGGIDGSRFNMTLSRTEARLKLGWPSDRPIILTVRRQVRRMGLETLVDAAKQIIRKHPDVLVLLGGSGPIAGELKQRIEDLNLQANVRLLGRIAEDDLPAAYRAADMTVVPTQSLEGFGLITLESLASGTPVFVTPVGGLPEVVQPFAPQCVLSNASANEMADTLGEALSGTLNLPSDAACRAYAVDNFSFAQIALRVRMVYDEALRN
jgi:glycosyltransferase involved in cell wall biosynthesis